MNLLVASLRSSAMDTFTTIPGLTGTTTLSSPSLSLPLLVRTLLVLPGNQLIQLLPNLKALAQSPIVLQVSTHHDHSQVLALRGSGLALLYSADDREAAANAQVASRVAATGRGVVHFCETIDGAVEGEEKLAEEQISQVENEYREQRDISQ